MPRMPCSKGLERWGDERVLLLVSMNRGMATFHITIWIARKRGRFSQALPSRVRREASRHFGCADPDPRKLLPSRQLCCAACQTNRAHGVKRNFEPGMALRGHSSVCYTKDYY